VTGDGLDLGILYPRIRGGGALEGTVQLHASGRLAYERATTLSNPDTLTEIARALTEKGVLNAEPELLRLITEARANVEEDVAQGNHRPPPSRHQGQAAWVVDQLEDGGRFLSTSAGRFYFNGTTRVPIDINSWDMNFLLWETFAVNPQQDISKYLTAHLDFHAHRSGERVQVRRFSHYDSAANILYVDTGAGRLLRVTAEGVEDIENGTDGVLFFPSSYQEPWTYEPTERGSWRLRPEVVDAFSFVEGEDTPLKPAGQSHLFILWLTSMFFRSVMPTRPIGLLVGDTGSGKSFAARTVGRILYGPEFEVDQLKADKEDDFWVSVCNDPFVAYDNADTRVRWLEDALATCATGVQQSKRKLYTEFGKVARRPDTFLVLTARTPRFRRPDVSGRLLIFHLAPRHLQNLPVQGEGVLHEQIAKARSAYMSELVDRCRLALSVPVERPTTSPLRLADFYAVAHRIGISLDLGPETHETLEKLRGVQHDFAAEENTLILTVQAWLEGSVDGVPNPNREVPARTLFTELRDLAAASRYRWDIANEKAMGRQLGELAEPLEEHFRIDKRKRRTANVYQIQPADWVEEGKLL